MTESRRHRVAVVLVSHNGARWLPQLLDALPASLSYAPQSRQAVGRDGAASSPEAPSRDMPTQSRVSAREPAALDAPDPIPAVSVVSTPASSALAVHDLWGDDALDWLDQPPPAAAVEVDPVLIAVDTGSSDNSADLAAEHGFTVLAAEPTTPFGRAAGIARTFLEQAGIDVQWLWLLHDDTAPLPGCLPEMLAAAEAESAAICGPLVVSWGRPSRLLERGIRITGSGRRVLGVDQGEVDQGQHDGDPPLPTLAVSSTAMLVRRDAWDVLNGYDPAFPMSGDDIDFCRRAHRAGFEVVVAPRAKVRHAQALSRNRRPESRSTRPVRDLRLAAFHLHLAHATRWAFPLVAARLVAGTAMRALGRLASRDVSGARDEVDGLLRFAAHPSRLVASRHRVASTALQPHSVERAYAVPLREQVRHWLRGVANLVEVVTRVRDADGASAIFLDDEEDRRPVRTEVWRRLAHRPQFLLPAALAVLLGVAGLGLLIGGGPIHGGSLPGGPEGGGDLWRSYLSGWHDVGRGTAAPAPAWLALLALVSTPLLGNVSLALSILFTLFPAGFAAVFTAATRGLIGSAWVRASLGVAFGLLPVFTHARDVGDFATLFAAMLLPLVARFAALALRTGQFSTCMLTGVLLTAACAFVPLLWLLAVASALFGWLLLPQLRGASSLRAIALIVASPWVVLLPQSIEWARHPYLLLMHAGAVQRFGAGAAGAAEQVLTMSPSGGVWWATGLVTVSVLAAVRGGSHRFTRNLGLFLLVPVLVVVTLSHVTFRVPGLAEPTHANPSAALLVLAGAAAVSIGTAADGLLASLRQQGLGSRHVVSLAGAAALAVSLGCGLWVWVSAPGSALVRGDAGDLPAFVATDLTSPERPRALVLAVDDPHPVSFAVRSAPTVRFGESDLLRMSEPDEPLFDAVAELIAQGPRAVNSADAAVRVLADSAIRYVVMRAEGNGVQSVASSLIGIAGVRQLSTPQAGQEWWVWRLPRHPSRATTVRLDSKGGGSVKPIDGFARSAVDPGRLAVSSAGPGPALSPAVIKVADVTQGWRATVDGRAQDISRTSGGTVVLDLPGGARSDLTLERVDRARSAWLTVQALVVCLAVYWCLPGRRRESLDDEGDS